MEVKDDSPETDETRRQEDLAEFLCAHVEEDMWHPCHTPAPLPENEEDRLRILHEFNLFDADDVEEDVHLACLVQLAQRTFQTSMAWIAVVDRHREWYMAREGIDYTHTHRDIALGAHSILHDDCMWVDDASQEERFMYSKLTYDTPHIKFYLSAPLFLVNNGVRYPIGCLAVADRESRSRLSSSTGNDHKLLQILASATMRRLETRQLKPLEREASADKTLMDEQSTSNFRATVLREFISVAGVLMEDLLITRLSERLELRRVQMGNFIVRKGDQGDAMYFVVSGRCVCLLNEQPMEYIVKGGCFGEMLIMNRCKMRAAHIPENMIARRCVRTADVRAVERCELLELTFESAWPLIKEIPALWSKLEVIGKLRSGKVALQRVNHFEASGGGGAVVDSAPSSEAKCEKGVADSGR